jgi:putative transposase
MKTLRRFYIPNAIYFVTVVAYDRRPFLVDDFGLFWHGWGDSRPLAWVVLPDHFHALINPSPLTISEVIQRFKLRYSRRYYQEHPKERLWQNRFWDHVIRGEKDLARHLDYIHYNPVHHGLAIDPFEYEHSSLPEWYERGMYQRDWGVVVEDYSSWQVGEPGG